MGRNVRPEFNKVYSFDETGNFQFGPVRGDLADSCFQDGRIAGLLVEHMVLHWFYPHLLRSGSEKASWDLEMTGGVRVECRSVTAGGVSLLPSSQLGAGRKYDEQGFLDKLSNVDAFCFVNVVNSPIFEVVFVRRDDLQVVKRMSISQWRHWVEELTGG